MIPPVLARMKALGYAVFDGDPYDLNIFGIRKRNGVPNVFDDLIGCAYRWDGSWRVHYWNATTDPGQYWLENPANVKGTAILCPGQYRGVWEVGKHRGRYDALIQRGAEVTVWRDADRDRNLDMQDATIDSGFFGINLHKAGTVSSTVDRYSAGCQVLQATNDFEELMKLAEMQIKITEYDSFTYTLLEEWAPIP